MQYINIGYGNIVASNRILSIITPTAAPIKRMVQEAKGKGILIDATTGRKTRAVIVMDTGHLVLSAIQPETIVGRLKGNKEIKEEE